MFASAAVRTSLRRAASVTALAVLAVAPGAAASAGIDGLWRTEPRADGSFVSVEIAPCAGAPEKRCGTVVDTHAGAPAHIVGEPILVGMSFEGGDRWGGGEIVRPGRGTRYSSRLRLVEDGLEVKGCVAGGWLCGGQLWTRP